MEEDKTMRQKIYFLLAIFLGFSALTANAERADRDKPINIVADRINIDDINKIQIFEGNVVMTQGTTLMRTNKLVVTQDEYGFRKGVATGGPAGLAYFRRKRDGSDDYMEGKGERVEHDARTEQTDFFIRAWVKSGQDEVRGSHISYNALTEQFYAVGGGDKRASGTPQGRVRAVIQPQQRSKEGEEDQNKSATPPLELIQTESLQTTGE